MPIMGSWFWTEYGADWWELDPPRHLFLFTKAGVATLAEQVGLKVVGTFHDSSARELIGSEQIRRDIPTYAPDSWFVDPARSRISDVDVARYADAARDLNVRGEAGRGGFILQIA